MNISEPIVFGAGDTFVIHGFQLNYPDVCQRVRTGDEVIVNNGMNSSEACFTTTDVDPGPPHIPHTSQQCFI